MAQSIRNIICDINDSLKTKLKWLKTHGVATLVETEGKVKPVVNGKNVSFDDSYGIQIYHRINSVGIKSSSGFGRNNDRVNSFAITAVVANNNKITKLETDELAMIMQSYFAQINNSASITPVSFILNTQAVWQTEYRGHTFNLPEWMGLMQFNYTVDITFKQGCSDLCPEDFSQCKIN